MVEPWAKYHAGVRRRPNTPNHGCVNATLHAEAPSGTELWFGAADT